MNLRIWLIRQWLIWLVFAPGLALAATFAYITTGGTGTVPVIDTASNTIVANAVVGNFPEALGQFIRPALAPDLNQHGLTGSWYEPATSGQGFELEVFEDLITPGIGLVFGGWFTFDSGAAGGDDKQRWYTLSGPMASGASSAPVTIYQNTGGNFNAAPVTNGQSVGSGTLTFSSCDTAQLSYAFSDGRSGTIPLTRLMPNVECYETTVRIIFPDAAFSGNWFNAATSGQGLIVEVNPVSQITFFAWHTYAPSGQTSGAAGQRWYTGLSTVYGGGRAAIFTLYQTVGGIFDTATPPMQSTSPVGTATLTFTSCTGATLAYEFTGGTNTGLSGTIALTRPGPAPPGCVF